MYIHNVLKANVPYYASSVTLVKQCIEPLILMKEVCTKKFVFVWTEMVHKLCHESRKTVLSICFYLHSQLAKAKLDSITIFIYISDYSLI